MGEVWADCSKPFPKMALTVRLIFSHFTMRLCHCPNSPIKRWYLSIHLNLGWFCLHPTECSRTGFCPVPAPVNGSEYREPWLLQMLKTSAVWGLSPKQDIRTTPIPLKLREHCGRGGRKYLRTRSYSWMALHSAQPLQSTTLNNYGYLRWAGPNWPYYLSVNAGEEFTGPYPYCWDLGYWQIWFLEEGESCLHMCPNCWAHQAPTREPHAADTD